MKKGWHLHETGEGYDPQEFFRDVFNTLINENILEVEKKKEGYWWRVKNRPSKVIVRARPGQMLMVSLANDNV